MKNSKALSLSDILSTVELHRSNIASIAERHHIPFVNEKLKENIKSVFGDSGELPKKIDIFFSEFPRIRCLNSGVDVCSRYIIESFQDKGWSVNIQTDIAGRRKFVFSHEYEKKEY